MTVRGAAFLGIGAMVGAGIFALLGEAAVVAGSAVWLSFLLAGLVTMLLAYNVVKLGIRYPSEPISALPENSDPGPRHVSPLCCRSDWMEIDSPLNKPSRLTRAPAPGHGETSD